VTRDLAKKLKSAGFAPRSLEAGRTFYPNETSAGWSEPSQQHGVTITRYTLQNHLQDIKEGYYCPNLTDLIEACGEHFGRLYVEQAIWTAESKDHEKLARAHSPEEAVANLWFALHRSASTYHAGTPHGQ
jgi:hypothetical protein